MFGCSDGMVMLVRIEWNKNTEVILLLVGLLELIAKWLFLCLVDRGIEWN